MPYSLVPLVPARPGSLAVGAYPLALDFDGHAIVLSPTLALAWTPAAIPDARVITICDDGLDVVTGPRRAALQTLLPDRTLIAGARFRDIIANMLKTPPPDQWRPLRPHVHRGQLEILLGPGNFLGPGHGNPGLLWSEPADVRGPHSQDIQDTFNRADQTIGTSRSSDNQFDWVELTSASGTTGVGQIVGNRAVFLRGTGDGYWDVAASVPMDTDDHWSQVNVVSLPAGFCYAGVTIRVDNVLLGQAGNGYKFLIDSVGGLYQFLDVHGNALRAAVSRGSDATGVISLAMSGTTYVGQMDGVTKLSGTDLVHSGAGKRHVGIFAGVEASAGTSVLLDGFHGADTIFVTSPITKTPSAGRLNLSDKNPIFTPNPAELSVTGRTPLLGTGARILTPDAGALEITSEAPVTLERGRITPPAGALTVAGELANVSRSLTPGAGAVVATGNAGQTVQGTRVVFTPGAGRLTLSLGTTLTPDAGALTLTGAAPSLGTVTPGTGALGLTGIVPVLSVGVGSVVKTPGAGELFFGEERVTPTTEGALSLTGQAPTAIVNFICTPPTVALVVTGQTPVLLGALLTPGTAVLTMTGQPAAVGHSLTPAAGTLTMVGVPPGVGGLPQMRPPAGAVAVAGYAPTVIAGGLVTLMPGTGALTVDGQLAGRGSGAVVAPDAGALVLASDPSLIQGLQLVPAAPELVLAGYAPSLFTERKFAPGTGALVMAGHPPNLGAAPPLGGRRFHVPPPRRFRFQTPQREEK